MLIRIDPTSDRPIYEQIASSVRSDAVSGRILPGAVLPAARDVAAGLGVNMHTVLRAYQQLRDEGLVDLRRGRGAVVTEVAGQLSALHRDVQALVDRAAAIGVTAETLSAIVHEDFARTSSVRTSSAHPNSSPTETHRPDRPQEAHL